MSQATDPITDPRKEKLPYLPEVRFLRGMVENAYESGLNLHKDYGPGTPEYTMQTAINSKADDVMMNLARTHGKISRLEKELMVSALLEARTLTMGSEFGRNMQSRYEDVLLRYESQC